MRGNYRGSGIDRFLNLPDGVIFDHVGSGFPALFFEGFSEPLSGHGNITTQAMGCNGIIMRGLCQVGFPCPGSGWVPAGGLWVDWPMDYQLESLSRTCRPTRLLYRARDPTPRSASARESSTITLTRWEVSRLKKIWYATGELLGYAYQLPRATQSGKASA